MYFGGTEILPWQMVNTSNERKDDASDAPTDAQPPKRSKKNSINQLINEKYNYYKHWARMIKSGQWSDKETSPNLPMITGKANNVAKTIATASSTIS